VRFLSGQAMAASRKPDRTITPYQFPAQQRALRVVQDNDCITALRALGEDTRARIVALLIGGPMDVNEIADRLGVSQYNISKHLRILREAGLLEVEKSGRQRRYALPDAIRRRAEAGHVLDLGCCSFQFNAASSRRQPSQPRTRRSRAGSGSTRAAR
jgi:DNA-binding transcriptional ArsR family regulator